MRPEAGAVIVAIALGLGGHLVSQKLQIGDLDPGAPELRANSRYNVDNAFITSARDGVVQQLDTQRMQLVGSVIVGREPMGVTWVARR